MKIDCTSFYPPIAKYFGKVAYIVETPDAETALIFQGYIADHDWSELVDSLWDFDLYQGYNIITGEEMFKELGEGEYWLLIAGEDSYILHYSQEPKFSVYKIFTDSEEEDK
jgi:hypothetical protein